MNTHTFTNYLSGMTLTRSCACIMLTCELQEALIGAVSCESHVCCVIIDALDCLCMAAYCLCSKKGSVAPGSHAGRGTS